MEREKINIAAEDNFSIVRMDSNSAMLPEVQTVYNLAEIVDGLENDWKLVFDFRNVGADNFYSDIQDIYHEVAMASDRTILVRPGSTAEMIGKSYPNVVQMKDKPFSFHELDLSLFNDDYTLDIMLHDYSTLISPHGSDYHEMAEGLGFINDVSRFEDLPPVDFEMLDREHEIIDDERKMFLQNYLRKVSCNSLLTEIAIVQNGKNQRIVPYHSFSIHNVKNSTEDDLLTRPGRFFKNYYSAFRKDIDELERLINQPIVKEKEIEALLCKSPLFLRGLNYKKAYHQVVLPTEDRNSLIPDIIVEPFGSEWCDIIDLKCPVNDIIVGRDNRKSLASSIHSVAAQLREYSAYFDNREKAKNIENKYGIRCYQPRLIAIVGRDPNDFGAEEIRRAMTAYPRFEIVTYDRLIKCARELVLL